MEKIKENKNLVITLTSILVILLLIGVAFLLKKDNSDNNNTTNTSSNNNILDTITGTPLEEINIENNEIKDLYNYLQPSIKEGVCLGFYYTNPFSNHSNDDKVSIVLHNYATNYKKEITDDMWDKLPEEEKTLLKNNGVTKYVEENIVKEGMKLLFNIDIDKFDKETYANYTYNQDLKVFIEGMSGSGYTANIKQQIIEYQESDDEINLTIVKADIKNNEVYRYANKETTLVYKNINYDNFVFTDDNISNFPQLKYVFKKNSEGKYYLSNIINLNFEEDFENCSK